MSDGVRFECEGCGREVAAYPRPASGFCRACDRVEAMFDDEPLAAQDELLLRLRAGRGGKPEG